MDTLPPVRVTGIAGYNPSADGRAFLLALQTSAKPLTLEVTEQGLRQLLMALTQASIACAMRRDDLMPMGEADPARGVLLPATDINVLNVRGAHKRLAIRVGIVDFTVMLDHPATAADLADALLSPPAPA